jgi:hypothetical protein
VRTIACLLSLFLLIGPQASAADGLLAPDWSLETADGKTIQLSSEATRQTAIGAYSWLYVSSPVASS